MSQVPRRPGPTRRSRLRKLALLVGYLSLSVALVAATSRPTAGPEFSVYRATPPAFWAGVGVALLVSVVVCVASGRSRWVTAGGLVLAASSAWSVVALPVVRGYFFYGGGDALSHLGFARAFRQGATSPFDLLHPGIHLLSLLVGAATGVRLGRSMVLVVFVFFLLFVLFVPLLVRRITGTPRGTVFGLFLAILFTPINNVSTHPVAHPSSQTILFAPFVLYALFVYLRQRSRPGLTPTPAGGLLGLASVAVVLYHPQEALNVLLIFASVATLQFLSRRVGSRHRIADHHPVYLQTAFLAVVFLLWASRSPRVTARLRGLYRSFFVSQPTPGSEVAGYSGSLTSVGGGLGELFVKLFLASAVVAVVAALAMLLTLDGSLDDVFPEGNAYNRYLTASFVPLAAVTAVVFLANFGDHYFRYVGFLTTVLTVLAAAALARGIPAIPDGVAVGAPAVRGAVVVVLVVLLPLAMLSVHPSPWIYQPTPAVSESTYDGYATAFEHRGPNVTFGGVRGGPVRYVDAVYGPRSAAGDRVPLADEPIPPAVFESNVSTHYDGPRYLPVTDTQVKREVGLYDGFRYGPEGYRRLETTPGIGRVYANQELRLYLLGDDRDPDAGDGG